MIVKLFEQRKKTITPEDLTKHNSRSISFYSLSKGNFVNDCLVNKTELFSDQIMIEIQQGCRITIIGTPSAQTVYTGINAMKYDTFNNQGYLYWQATDQGGVTYLIAILMVSGAPQIKLTNLINESQIVHNVCELPR
ncbi:hypothetical protein SAMN04487890_102461 [Mucilaginibacter polytrichastri]|nr:hypothetical protein SAMN04487890_102461 [Mucilaginibacter polytrichastri]